MPTIGEILRKRFPDLDLTTAGTTPEPAEMRMTMDEQSEWFRDRAVAAHERRVPPLFASARATVPDVTAWADAFATGTLGRHHSLLLLGLTGTGKTHQAYGALRRIAESGIRYATWCGGTVPQLLAELRPSGGDPDAAFERLATAPVLLLDDIGSEKSSPWTEEIGLRLIDTRYSQRRPIIVTGNGSWADLSTTIGDRLSSRLVEMCNLVEFKGADRRAAR
jgi:DNA replication protein DnaC